MRPSPSVSWSGLCVLVGVVVVCAACQPRTPAPDRTETARVAWRVIGTWSGRGNSQTESFTVETGALRLRWETRNESTPGAGRLRVSLHSAISGRPLQTVIEHTGVGSDTAFLQDDPRVSYLVIDSRDVDWTATLEEAVKEAPPGRTAR